MKEINILKQVNMIIFLMLMMTQELEKQFLLMMEEMHYNLLKNIV